MCGVVRLYIGAAVLLLLVVLPLKGEVVTTEAVTAVDDSSRAVGGMLTAGEYFTDQWAVRVDGTEDDARRLADLHGFTYVDKVRWRFTVLLCVMCLIARASHVRNVRRLADTVGRRMDDNETNEIIAY